MNDAKTIFGREVDKNLQEIVWRGLIMDFTWGQKLEVRESGLTAVQEHVASLGIVEFGGGAQPKEMYDDERYDMVCNPMAELDGRVSIGPRRYDEATRLIEPRVKTGPFLLIPKDLALKIKVLGCMP